MSTSEVFKEKIDKAIVLKYLKNLPAPFIVCKGKRKKAEKILQIARDNNIEIVEEGDLADRLFEFESGDYIPEELYEITAGILAFVYNLQEHK